MLVLIESIIFFALTIVNWFITDNELLQFITYIILVLGLIPMLIKIFKRGLRAIRVTYNITSTNILLVLLNMLLYVPYYLNIKFMIYCLVGINALKIAIDIIKLVTGREILV